MSARGLALYLLCLCASGAIGALIALARIAWG